MRKPVLLLVLALLLAGIVFLFLAEGGDSPAAPEGPGPSAEPALETQAPPPAPPPAPAQEAPGARTEIPGAPPEPAPVSEPIPDEEALLVEVIAEADDRPVPGCVLYAVDMTEVDQNVAPRLLVGSQDVLAVLRQVAHRYQADEEGFARIRKPKGPLVLAGEAPGLFHFELFPTAAGMARLTLRLEAEVVVQALVLDDAGQPREGVPVVVRAAQAFFSLPVAHETTGPDGLATLRNFKAITQFTGDEHMEFEIAVAAPFPEEIMAPLDLRNLPPEPIVLRLPPTGSAVVEVRDIEGHPVEDGTVVTLQKAEEADVNSPRAEGLPQPGQASAPTVRGRASFPAVGLGLQLRAAALMEEFPSPVTTDAPGPTTPGEEVHIRLQPEQGPTWLVGRLLDDQGEVMAKKRVQARFEVVAPEGRSSDYGMVQTDGEGRFRYGLDPPSVDPGTTRTLILLVMNQEGGALRMNGAPRAELELAAEYPPGDQDLGDITLRRPPLLAAGTVLTPGGRPVKDARVIYQKHESGAGRGEGWWNSDWQFSGETDGAGAFQLFGTPKNPENRPVRLVAQAEGFREGHADFLPGQTGITITLQGAGRVRGSVLVDADIEPSDLSVTFVEELEEGNRRNHGASWEENEFYWDDLEAGTGRVEIRADGAREPLHVVDEVTVVVGEENRDPRLQDIDLRGRLRHIRLEFVDEHGRRVNQVMLSSLDPERHFWEYEWDGVMDLLVTEELPPLTVAAEGYMSERLENVTGDRRIVLRRGAELEFLLDSPPDLPSGWFLAVGLAPTEGGLRFSPYNQAFDAAGRCVYRAPGTGTWEVHAYLGHRDGNSTTTWGHGGGLFLPETIAISDPSAPATFHLSVDRAKLAEYLAQAQAKD